MHTTSSKQIRMLHWNSNGISNFSNQKQFEILLESKGIHIASLNETFFKSNHKPYFTNYFIYRNDRIQTVGGGVALLIHKTIAHTILPLTKTTLIESISAEIVINNRKIVVTSAYSPRYTPAFRNDIIS